MSEFEVSTQYEQRQGKNFMVKNYIRRFYTKKSPTKSLWGIQAVEKVYSFMHIDEKEFYDLMLKEEPPFISRRC